MSVAFSDKYVPPLSVACFKGHTQTAVLLLDAKADLEWRSEGDTPIDLASRRGRVETVAMLLARGATVNARSVAQAESKGHDAVLALLHGGRGGRAAAEVNCVREQAR